MPYISELKTKIYNEKYRFIIENKHYFHGINNNNKNKYTAKDVKKLIQNDEEKSVWIINPDNMLDVQESIKKIKSFVKSLSVTSKEGTIEDMNRVNAEKKLKEWEYWLASFQVLLNALSH